jgi:WD40 repeat protein
MTSAWHIAGVADVTKDGTDDVVWVDTNNNVEIWQMKNGKVAEIINPNGHMGTEWHFASVGDVTGDGRSDLVWAKSDGTVAVWDIGQVSTVAALSAIDNFQFASSPEAAPSGPMQWVAEAAGPFNDTQTTTSGLDFASMDLAQNHDSLVAHALPFYHDLLT